jgi:transcriptional regulator with XRE-family HTH domain
MSEIKLSDHIRDSLRTERLKNKIKGTDICKLLDKHQSFVSHIENHIVKSVQYDDLKKIFGFILQIEDPQLSKYLDELIKIDDTEKPNQKNTIKKNEEPNYQKLYEDRQEEQLEKLQDIVEIFRDEMSYYPPDYDDCEDDNIFETVDKFLTTYIDIMLNSESEISQSFYNFMKLPLQKLNPVQFHKLIDYANNLLEYEYVFESGQNSKTQKYPHYRARYKKELLNKLNGTKNNNSNEDESEDSSEDT